MREAIAIKIELIRVLIKSAKAGGRCSPLALLADLVSLRLVTPEGAVPRSPCSQTVKSCPGVMVESTAV